MDGEGFRPAGPGPPPWACPAFPASLGRARPLLTATCPVPDSQVPRARARRCVLAAGAVPAGWPSATPGPRDGRRPGCRPRRHGQHGGHRCRAKPYSAAPMHRCTDAPMVMMRPIAATTGQPFLPDRGAVDSAWQVPVRTRPRALRRPGRPRPLGRCRGGGGGLVRRPPTVSPSPRHVDRHKRRPCWPAPRATPLPGLYVTRLVPAAESGVGVAGTGINGTRDGTAHSSAAAARRRRHGQRGEALLARR